jgi:hypothetical protein
LFLGRFQDFDFVEQETLVALRIYLRIAQAADQFGLGIGQQIDREAEVAA